MRGRAAAVVFALCFCISNALNLSRIFPLHFDNTDKSLPKLLSCSQRLGITKCLTAFSVWRAQNAIELIADGQQKFDLHSDLRRFPWERYANESEDLLYAELCEGTEKLLQYRRLAIDVYPDYSLELGSSGNGTLNIDVIKNKDVHTGRGYMKKWRKKFYNIVPLLLVPGLIMSAILPFVLPALKMMTIAVGMLNNMALSGAVFTLLRNNAFNDANRHRVIYVNEGYHNEKHHPASSNLHQYSEPNREIFGEISHNGENIIIDSNTEVKEIPINANLPWFPNENLASRVIYADTKIKRNN